MTTLSPTQQEARAWLKAQPDIIECRMYNGRMTRRACVKRQRKYRHFIASSSLTSQDIQSPYFYQCFGCNYFQPLKVHQNILSQSGHIQAGKMPLNLEEDTYAAD